MSLFDYFSGLKHSDFSVDRNKMGKVVEKLNEWGTGVNSADELNSFLSIVSLELNESPTKILVLLKKALEEKLISGKFSTYINEQILTEIDEEDKEPELSNDEEAGDAGEPTLPDTEGAGGGGEDVSSEDFEQDKSKATAEELPEIELIGLTQDVFYSLVRKTIDSGEVTDLVVQDQEENDLLSAKDKGIDINDTKDFIRVAVKELDMEWVDPDILDKYELLKTKEDEFKEAEGELPGEKPQGIPKVEAKPGEVGGPQMVAPYESKQRIKESMDDVFKKAGVDNKFWWDTGKAVYFRGVSDDVARALAEELVGTIVGKVPMDGLNFYKIILESKINEGYEIIAADIINRDTANDLARDKNGIVIEDPKKEGSFLVLRDEE